MKAFIRRTMQTVSRSSVRKHQTSSLVVILLFLLAPVCVLGADYFDYGVFNYTNNNYAFQVIEGSASKAGDAGWTHFSNYNILYHGMRSITRVFRKPGEKETTLIYNLLVIPLYDTAKSNFTVVMGVTCSDKDGRKVITQTVNGTDVAFPGTEHNTWNFLDYASLYCQEFYKQFKEFGYSYVDPRGIASQIGYDGGTPYVLWEGRHYYGPLFTDKVTGTNPAFPKPKKPKKPKKDKATTYSEEI